MRKLKIYQKIILLFVLFFLLSTLFFLNALFGNPLVKFIASQKADAYIEEHYKNLQIEKKETVYNFKLAEYVVYLEIKDSLDSHFTLCYDSFGRFRRDTFPERIFNTYLRFERELHAYGKKVQEKYHLPYELHLRVLDTEDEDIEKSLHLDEEVDFTNFPLKVEAHVVAFSTQPNFKELLTVLKNTQKIMQQTSLKPSKYSIILVPEANRGKDGEATSYMEALSIYDIDPKMIENDDLEGLKNLEQSQNKSKDKYAQ